MRIENSFGLLASWLIVLAMAGHALAATRLSSAPLDIPDVASAHPHLVYLHHRFYDPALGRFITPDPITFVSGVLANRYGYVANRPATLTDISGLSPVGLEDFLNDPDALIYPTDLKMATPHVYSYVRKFPHGLGREAINTGFADFMFAMYSSGDPRYVGRFLRESLVSYSDGVKAEIREHLSGPTTPERGQLLRQLLANGKHVVAPPSFTRAVTAGNGSAARRILQEGVGDPLPDFDLGGAGANTPPGKPPDPDAKGRGPGGPGPQGEAPPGKPGGTGPDPKTPPGTKNYSKTTTSFWDTDFDPARTAKYTKGRMLKFGTGAIGGGLAVGMFAELVNPGTASSAGMPTTVSTDQEVADFLVGIGATGSGAPATQTAAQQASYVSNARVNRW